MSRSQSGAQPGRVADAIQGLRVSGSAMLIVTKTSSLLVDGNVDVLYGVFHARQAWQPVMSMKHSTLGRWTVQSVHWKKKTDHFCVLAVFACAFCAAAFLDFLDEILFMPNEILKRFVFFRFSSKISDRKYFSDCKNIFHTLKFDN